MYIAHNTSSHDFCVISFNHGHLLMEPTGLTFYIHHLSKFSCAHPPSRKWSNTSINTVFFLCYNRIEKQTKSCSEPLAQRSALCRRLGFFFFLLLSPPADLSDRFDCSCLISISFALASRNGASDLMANNSWKDVTRQIKGHQNVEQTSNLRSRFSEMLKNRLRWHLTFVWSIAARLKPIVSLQSWRMKVKQGNDQTAARCLSVERDDWKLFTFTIP
jgi:hypothetical protein